MSDKREVVLLIGGDVVDIAGDEFDHNSDGWKAEIEAIEERANPS